MNETTDDFTGIKAEFMLKRSNPQNGGFIVVPPAPSHSLPVEDCGPIRGRLVTVASFPTPGQPVHHRGLRAWSEPRRVAVNADRRDPFLWRVEVCTDEDWWRHRLLGTRPSWIGDFPAIFVWVDEEQAMEHPTPWPT